MPETPIGADVELVLAGLERLALGLAEDLVRQNPDAGALIRRRLEAVVDGTPGRPGAWFRLASPAQMRRVLDFLERMTRAAAGEAAS